MINPKYAFFHDVVVLGQNLQNMCNVIAEGHRKLATGGSHWGLVLINLCRTQYSGDAKAEKGPFLTRDLTGLFRWPSVGMFKITESCLILRSLLLECFPNFFIRQRVGWYGQDMQDNSSARWVRFSAAFCAVWSITVSTRFDILYDLSSNQQVNSKVLYIFTPIYQK